MPRTLDPLHYEMVAEVVVEAAVETHRTSVAVAETWNVPVETARRWVKESRRRGLLGSPEPRCSGRCSRCCGANAGG